ncbi:dolichol-phosphate mannosyltransferase [Lewinella marina]|uniref:Dolichyl-phosphate beta-D-mannosyltransferase n=1 Tax=Neolewinella marina TaxID=438751 RepID=A0A2G0CG24_9BACT|nr:polyprenol monophosphomannose synthase [Neolewinella marina]NJB86615.1 dolichol-phosphate mannosyltransferase [Neolewinella marina]PHK98934.1 dolichyl-phosphate beta-D-mannosyltransferase [Neolewinella marina]
MKSSLSDSLVIIPTYNERENITRMVEAVLGLSEPFHLLIVDDGSPDGTADLVRELQQRYPGALHLLERAGKLGLGTAYLDGFRWGLARPEKYRYFFEMDADFSHTPADLIRLRAACHEGPADVAVGSRYTRGGKVKNWPLDRIILSYGASLYTRIVTGMPVKDPTAGFMCYSRPVLEKMDLDEIRFIGYAFQIEMKYTARQLGFRIVEVPIVFTDRIAGNSKMHKSIIKEAVLGVLSLRWR